MSATATLGLDAERGADPLRYTIGDAAPRIAVRPVSRDEAAEALRAATSDRLTVVPWGGGTALAREAAPTRYDVALDLGALDRVIEYEPADMTLTAECGVTIAALRATLAARGQELPMEGGVAARATLGGVLACNASGPRRLRFGAPYDRLMGARFALADGTIARSGGKVVKNVAGYAIHRLLCGSRGGLAVLLEASLKLVPAPEARVVLEYECSARELAARERWAALPRLEPAAVTIAGDGADRFEVTIALEGDAGWVEEQVGAVTNSVGAPSRRLEGEAVGERLQAMTDRAAGVDAPASLELVTPENTPAGLEALLDIDPRAGFVFHAPAGRLHLFTSPGQAQTIVDRLGASGFALIGARGIEVTPALPPQVALGELRTRIREALDPTATLALGER